MTFQNIRPSGGVDVWLKNRFFACVVAFCAYLMGRLAVLHALLQPVYEGSGIKLTQLVPLLLSFPVFKLHQSLFKFAYALNKKRFMLLGFQEFGGELKDKRVARCSIFDLKELLAESDQRRKALVSRIEFANQKNHSSFG